jgi:hypothetical protein
MLRDTEKAYEPKKPEREIKHIRKYNKLKLETFWP